MIDVVKRLDVLGAVVSSRRRIASSVLGITVVTLLAISFASVGNTSGYLLFQSGTGHRAAPGVAVAYGAVADPIERIRIVLHAVPRGTDAHRVAVVGSTAPHEMVPTTKDAAKSLALAAQAALFAAFGLVLLWFGHDRASLWLGVCCASLAPELVTLYGFVPEPLMLICRIAADLLTFVAFYALFAMADTVAVESLPNGDTLHHVLTAVRAFVVALIAAAAAADVAALLLPVLRGTVLPGSLVQAGTLATTLCWCVVFCLLPAVLLGLAAARAASPDRRKRARIILITTLAGLSGVALSIASELSAGAAPHFETLWFTLLLIPLGFIIVIRAFGVIAVQVVVNRILVISAMTFIVGQAIKQTEGFVDAGVEHWLKPADASQQREFDAVLLYLVGFVIVLIFNAMHDRINDGLEGVVYRHRNRALAQLAEFSTTTAPAYTGVADLWNGTVAVVREAVGTGGAAIYALQDGAYELSATAGAWDRTMVVSGTDPRFDTKRGAAAGVYLFHLSAGPTEVGLLAVQERSTAVDPALDEKEIAALGELARTTAATTMALRLAELTEFVADVADGRVADGGVRARAALLRAETAQAVHLHAPASEPVAPA